MDVIWQQVCCPFRDGLWPDEVGFDSGTLSLSTTCRFRDIDKVDDLMQDITEQQELAQEISDAISKPVGLGEQFDEVGEGVRLQIRGLRWS